MQEDAAQHGAPELRARLATQAAHTAARSFGVIRPIRLRGGQIRAG